MTVRAEIAAEALDKLRRGAPYSVAAVFIGEVTQNGLDGAQWRLYVSDGRESGYVEAQISGTNGGHRGMSVEPAFLEFEVEFISGRFARVARLQRLLAASPVAIEADRLPIPV